MHCTFESTRIYRGGGALQDTHFLPNHLTRTGHLEYLFSCSVSAVFPCRTCVCLSAREPRHSSNPSSLAYVAVIVVFDFLSMLASVSLYINIQGSLDPVFGIITVFAWLRQGRLIIIKVLFISILLSPFYVHVTG